MPITPLSLDTRTSVGAALNVAQFDGNLTDIQTAVNALITLVEAGYINLAITGNFSAAGTGSHSFGTTSTVVHAAGVTTNTKAAGGLMHTWSSGNATGIYLKLATSGGAKGYFGTADQTLAIPGSVDDFVIDAPAGDLILAVGSTRMITLESGSGNVSFVGVAAVGGATVSTSTALITPASVAGVSSLRIPHGTAPTAPVNGDLWTTTAGLFARINGATVGPFS